jgi:hypothetical protein
MNAESFLDGLPSGKLRQRTAPRTVLAAGRDEPLAGAALGDFAVLQDHDLVDLIESLGLVRDAKGRPSAPSRRA